MPAKNDNSLYIGGIVASYWIVSISMVYLNKVLMSNEGVSINAPLFVIWYQCIITSLICWGAGKCGDRARKFKKTHSEKKLYSLKASSSSSSASPSSNIVSPARKGDEENNLNSGSLNPNKKEEEEEEETIDESNSKATLRKKLLPKEKEETTGQDRKQNQQNSSFFTQFPTVEFNASTARKVFPLSVIFVCMITFNNLCLKWVEVSFYNVARSFTIVFNVFFSYAVLGIKSSCKTIGCLMIVIAGFLIGSIGEINFSVKGTIAGVMSSLFVCLTSIFTKKVLPIVDDNHWSLTFYNNINASILFIPLILIFEQEVIYDALEAQLVSPTFWTAMTIAGVFGFTIGIVATLQIKATSPLTHNISGTAKAALQSMLAFYIFGNDATILGVMGIFTTLGGSLLYTYVKMTENKTNAGTAKASLHQNSNDAKKFTSRSIEIIIFVFIMIFVIIEWYLYEKVEEQ